MQVVARGIVLALAAFALSLPAAAAVPLTSGSDLDISAADSVPVDLTPLLLGLPSDLTPTEALEAVEAALAEATPIAPPTLPVAPSRLPLLEFAPGEAPTLDPADVRVPAVPPHVVVVAVPVPPAVVLPAAPVALPEAAAPAPRVPPAAAAPAAVAVGLAGAAATTALANPAVLGRFYSRLARGEALAHPMRRRIYDAIDAEPGLSPTDLRALTGLGNGALLHHLDVLRREGLIVRMEGGRHVRLFLAGRHSKTEMTQRVTVLTGSAERVLAVVQARPGVPMREAASELGLSVPAVHRTIEKLEAAGLVTRRREGRAHAIYPADAAPGIATPVLVA